MCVLFVCGYTFGRSGRYLSILSLHIRRSGNELKKTQLKEYLLVIDHFKSNFPRRSIAQHIHNDSVSDQCKIELTSNVVDLKMNCIQ